MTSVYSDSKFVTDSKACLNYMLNYLEIVFAITCNFLNLSKDPESIAKKKKLWNDVNDIDDEAASRLRKRLVLVLTNLPGAPGRVISKYGYRAISKLLGLN